MLHYVLSAQEQEVCSGFNSELKQDIRNKSSYPEALKLPWNQNNELKNAKTASDSWWKPTHHWVIVNCEFDTMRDPFYMHIVIYFLVSTNILMHFVKEYLEKTFTWNGA